MSEADSLQKSIVKSLCNIFSSQGHEVYLSDEHPLANYGGHGTLIILKDGLISVYISRSLGENKNRYMIWLKIFDYNNQLFLRSQDYNNTLIEKSKLKNKSTKKNKIRKRKK